MKTVSRLMLGGAALAMAGCSHLPGSSLGGTFTAERYLKADHGGSGTFEGALAKEYTELGRRAAFTNVRWRNATAYIAKAEQAESGVAPAPWAPDQLGVGGEAASMYQEVVNTINTHKAVRPDACARAQAMWDQYLEALYGQPAICLDVDETKALLDEALAACAGGGPANWIVYFGFDRTDLTAEANATLDQVVSAISGMSGPQLSIVGHADRVGSVAYNQGLSERRATRVARALADRGVPPGSMTLAGRSENDPAVPTADGVREARNRRVEITVSQ